MLLNIIDIILRGFIVGLISSVTVGPVAVLCIKRTLNKSRRSGFISGMGVACADTLMAIIAFFFYALMHSQIERYRHILSIVGGIFVVIVGVVIFLQKPSQKTKPDGTVSNTPWRDFSSMFGFTIANFVVIIPYLLAFFAMFGVGMAESKPTPVSLLGSGAVIAGFLCGASAFASAYLLAKFNVHNMLLTVVSIMVAVFVYIVAVILFKIIKKSDIISLPKGEKLAKVLEKFKVLG